MSNVLKMALYIIHYIYIYYTLFNRPRQFAVFGKYIFDMMPYPSHEFGGLPAMSSVYIYISPCLHYGRLKPTAPYLRQSCSILDWSFPVDNHYGSLG